MQNNKTAEFDFSGLFELLQSMKRQFWNNDRSQERFKKQLRRLHDSYFSKLNQASTAQISMASKKALKKKMPKAPAGTAEDDFQNAVESLDDLDTEITQQVLTNPLLISILEDMRKKQQAGLMQDDTRLTAKAAADARQNVERGKESDA